MGVRILETTVIRSYCSTSFEKRPHSSYSHGRICTIQNCSPRLLNGCIAQSSLLVCHLLTSALRKKDLFKTKLGARKEETTCPDPMLCVLLGFLCWLSGTARWKLQSLIPLPAPERQSRWGYAARLIPPLVQLGLSCKDLRMKAEVSDSEAEGLV